MKAYLTTIGEQTTELCRWQLDRIGFEVVVLDAREPWIDKYRRFIDMAEAEGTACVRIDADVIPNRVLGDYARLWFGRRLNYLMIQFHTYDFYQNQVGITCPVIYSRGALEIIKRDFDQLDPLRPEATAWRLPDINRKTMTSDLVVGFHGFFQDEEAIKRAMENKARRNQSGNYDWQFVFKSRELLP